MKTRHLIRTRAIALLLAVALLVTGPMFAFELSPGIKLLETSLQTRLQEQILSLFGESSGIVVNVQIQEGPPLRAPRRQQPRGGAEEMDLGYVSVPVSPEAEEERVKPEAKLSVKSVEVNLWIPKDTDTETVDGVRALVKQTLSSYSPTIRMTRTAVSWSDNILKKLSVWKPYLPVIAALGAALLLVFGLTIMAFTIRRSAGAIAERLPSVGSSGGGMEATVNIEKEEGEDGSAPRLALPSPSSAPALPMATMRIQALKLRTELLENMNQTTEAAILRHLSGLLASDSTIERAVVLLELLGKEAASGFFKRLPLQSRQCVVQFMRQGVMSRPKMDLMMETAEELKTKLLVDSFDGLKSGASEEVAEQILHLNEAELAQAFLKLPLDAVARMYLYLEPAKISAALTQLRKLDKSRFDEAVDMLVRMPEVSKSDHLDSAILKMLGEFINKVEADVQSPFLSTYQEIVETADDETASDIMSKLSTNARVDSYLSENIITPKTLFRLEPKALADMIASLSNKDLAALCLSCSKEEQKVLVVAAGARRRPLIAEEFDTLSHRGGKQAAQAISQMKSTVVKRLQTMKNEGSLTLVSRDTETKALASPATTEEEIDEETPQKRRRGGTG